MVSSRISWVVACLRWAATASAYLSGMLSFDLFFVSFTASHRGIESGNQPLNQLFTQTCSHSDIPLALYSAMPADTNDPSKARPYTSLIALNGIVSNILTVELLLNAISGSFDLPMKNLSKTSLDDDSDSLIVHVGKKVKMPLIEAKHEQSVDGNSKHDIERRRESVGGEQ